MDNKDELMFYAGMALMGLVARGEAPSIAGQQAWQYAQFMINFKPKEQDNGN
jgi:hypothetical protein